MKIIFLLSLCVLFSLNVFGQPDPVEAEREVAVEEITLAKDDGNGKVGETADGGFKTTDIPIHCSVLLTSTRAATVKMNFVAVKVAGVKPETKVFTVSYKTNGKQNRVNFTGKPEDVWTAGSYRIDIFIDDKASGSREFEIRSAHSKAEIKKPVSPPPTKPAPKPKIAKRNKKN